jgi:hypothetical protein
VDELVVIITPPCATSRSQRLRRIALQQVREQNSSSEERAPSGLRIRTAVDLASVASPPGSPEHVRKRLRQVAKCLAKEDFRHPYVWLRAQVVERHLPLITAKIAFQGLDSDNSDPICKLKPADMIWDTGAHQTIAPKTFSSGVS